MNGFDPRPTKYPYPEFTDGHYLKIKKDDGTVFDRDYPYIDDSPAFLRKRRLFDIVLRLIVFPMTRIRLGLKVRGKENLKKHSEALKNGAILCSNHVHLWDFLAIRSAVLPNKPYVLVWSKNVSGENGKNVRLVGGIPIPRTGPAATKAQLKAVRKMLNAGGWLQIYSEGSMWEYYRPVRPFKKGAARLSVMFEKPLVPMAFSFRRPGWIRRTIFRQIALFTLSIGEPLCPDASLGVREQEEELCKRSHEAVCRLAGIDPSENIYPPVFQNNKKINY